MSLKEVKDELINLYLTIKVRKAKDIEKLTKDELEIEKAHLNNLPVLDIINYINNTIDTLIELKAIEKFQKYLENQSQKNNYINTEDQNDENGLKLYEGLLIKAESAIRKHISVIYKKYLLIFI